MIFWFMLFVFLPGPSPAEQPEPISYQTDIAPLLQLHCATAYCHDGTVYPELTQYKGVAKKAKRIAARLRDPKRPMPPLGVDMPLDSAARANILAWIEAGAME